MATAACHTPHKQPTFPFGCLELATISTKMRKCLGENSRGRKLHCHSVLTLCLCKRVQVKLYRPSIYFCQQCSITTPSSALTVSGVSTQLCHTEFPQTPLAGMSRLQEPPGPITFPPSLLYSCIRYTGNSDTSPSPFFFSLDVQPERGLSLPSSPKVRDPLPVLPPPGRAGPRTRGPAQRDGRGCRCPGC